MIPRRDSESRLLTCSVTVSEKNHFNSVPPESCRNIQGVEDSELQQGADLCGSELAGESFRAE